MIETMALAIAGHWLIYKRVKLIRLGRRYIWQSLKSGVRHL